jgi:hypothetical protein
MANFFILFSVFLYFKRFFLYKWSDFIQRGKSVADEELENRIQQIAPNKCATLIYTVNIIDFISLNPIIIKMKNFTKNVQLEWNNRPSKSCYAKP